MSFNPEAVNHNLNLINKWAYQWKMSFNPEAVDYNLNLINKLAYQWKMSFNPEAVDYNLNLINKLAYQWEMSFNPEAVEMLFTQNVNKTIHAPTFLMMSKLVKSTNMSTWN